MEVSEFRHGMTAVMIEDLPNARKFKAGTVVIAKKGPGWEKESTNTRYLKEKTVMVRIHLPGEESEVFAQRCYLRRLRPVHEQLSLDFGEERVQLGPPSLV